MTESDPIRAALEAATYAMQDATDINGCVPPAPEDRAADAIAAFLRALPDQYTRGGAAFWDAIPAHEETRLWLAAAVERAAGEEPPQTVPVSRRICSPINRCHALCSGNWKQGERWGEWTWECAGVNEATNGDA